jgi:hypothetical protein
MSQDPEKYLYFNVGLLKNSFALEALTQDALKYHLIDQPGKLIALRLTEYYEMIAQGNLPQGTGLPLTLTSTPFSNAPNPTTGKKGDGHPNDRGIVAASPDVEENADEAAEYWSRL